MIDRQIKNAKGFTLLEMMMAVAISAVVLATSFYIYNKQDKVLREENKSLQLRDFARLAMDEMVPNMRMAGYGFPPGDSTVPTPGWGIATASATIFAYSANTDNITLYANLDRPPGSTGVFVPLNGTVGAFSVGDNVVYFDTRIATSRRAGLAVSIGNNTPLAGYDTIGLGSANGFVIRTHQNRHPFHSQ